MTDPYPHSPATPRWLHWWAVLTVCATVPLLLLGAEVTTKQVGMVDPQGFRPPWHMLAVPLREVGLGFIIEHSHRLAGYAVGTCIIVLAAGLWLCESRRWLRWLGVGALAAVIVQGLLGGFRVQLNALFGRDLALIHGLFAQLVFALLVSLALFTAGAWESPQAHSLHAVGLARLRLWSLLVTVVVYVQILFGAVVRHTELAVGPRFHLFGACLLVGLVVWQVSLVLTLRPRGGYLTRTVLLLASLLALQIGLGVEAWLAKFTNVDWPQLRPLSLQPELVRSFHYLVGALLFATSVVLTLQSYRVNPWAVQLVETTFEPLEGAA